MNCQDVALLAASYLEGEELGENPVGEHRDGREREGRASRGSTTLRPPASLLSPLERSQIRAHLARCGGCRIALERLAQVDEVELPLALRLKIQDRLDPARLQALSLARMPLPSAELPRHTKPRIDLSPLALAAAALFAAWLGFQFAQGPAPASSEVMPHPGSADQFRPAGWAAPDPQEDR